MNPLVRSLRSTTSQAEEAKLGILQRNKRSQGRDAKRVSPYLLRNLAHSRIGKLGQIAVSAEIATAKQSAEQDHQVEEPTPFLNTKV